LRDPCLDEPLKQKNPPFINDFVNCFPSFDSKAAELTVKNVFTHSPGLADVLSRIQVPMTILMGDEDLLYPEKEMRPIAELAKNAKIEIIKECGHLAPLEAPEAVADAIRAISKNQ
jgi:pimeloyl-ACP methyl ester carboxylesterase